MNKTFVFCIALLAAVNCSLAQPGGRSSQLSGAYLQGNTSFQLPTMSRMTPAAELVALVDSSEYVLGPGDAIQIAISQPVKMTETFLVSNEGLLTLPFGMPIVVAGVTLVEAKEKITREINRFYSGSEISITLVSLRKFKVYVTGVAQVAGTYTVRSNMRVSDLFEIKENVGYMFRYRRNIEMRKGVQVLEHVDLATFYNTGDLSVNPYLQEGVLVHVPPVGKKVTVRGAVMMPGVFDYIPGDDLWAILKAAGGMSYRADSGNIHITRFLDDNVTIDTISVSMPQDKHFALKPDDRIMVRSKYKFRQEKNVIVLGEAYFPGTYPIVEGSSRLVDVIKAAGGIAEQGFLSGAHILRGETNLRMSIDPNGDEEVATIFKTLQSNPLFFRPEVASYWQSLLLQQRNVLKVDFKQALRNSENENNVLLHPGDTIVIPKKPTSILVVGAVKSPGLIEYDPDFKSKDYLEHAGGFSKYANRGTVLIKKAGYQTWSTRNSVEIQPGDLLFVPEKRYRDELTFTREILSIVSSLITVVVSVLTVRELLSNNN